MSDQIDPEKEIQQRIQKYIGQLGEFYLHLFIFIGVNLLLWGIWYFIRPSTGFFLWLADIPIPWPLIVTFAWGIGLIGHFLNVYFNSPRWFASQEELIRKSIERERQRHTSFADRRPKAKHDDRYYSLSDDGELVELDDELSESDNRRKNNR
jgi:hypothetical protein